MKEYIAPKWHKNLSGQGLLGFDLLWNMKADLIDVPNTGRKGWSNVAVFKVKLPDGSDKELVLKRQLNHTSRTYFHPFTGIPTFEKEVINSRIYKRLEIPAMEIIYYCRRHSREGIRAVLVTEYLSDHISLEKIIESWEKKTPALESRKMILTAVAQFVSHLHKNKIQHNCLYSKHIFIRQKDEKIDVRVIDLENSKWRPFGSRRRVRDLESLSRRICWKSTDRLRFFMAYCGIDYLDQNSKRLCRKIFRRTRKKLKRREYKK